MPDFTSTQLPLPSDWQAFQRLCAELWQRIWQDPDTQIHGRPGQKQDGIDVYGRPGQGSTYEGVQCKGKDVRYGQSVTEKELREEVEKAKFFEPPISRFILATTAPSDREIQRVAREITIEHQKAGLFSVVVLGWDEIHLRLGDHPELIKKHYPFLNPKTSQLADEITLLSVTQIADSERAENRHLETLGVMEEKILPLLQRIVGEEAGSESPIDKHLNDDIDQCRGWIHHHKSKEALEQLERIRDQNWDEATDRTKFRVTTNIAAAKLKLGDEGGAASGFLEAIKFDPDDEIGLCNLAVAHLLMGNQKEALDVAEKVTNLFPESGRAYSLLVSVKAEEPSPDDPTELVPAELLETVDVAYAVGRFYIKKGKYSEAVEWMKRANEASPDDVETKAGLAEATLTQIIKDDAVAKGRVLSPTQRSEVEESRALLQDVWSKVRKSDEAARFIVHAFNLGSANYLLGDIEQALRVIEDALLIAPGDPMLHRQTALIGMVQGNFSRSADILSKLPDDAFPEKVLMEAEALNGADRTEEALRRVKKFLDQDCPEGFTSQAKRLHLELISKEHSPEAAMETAKQYLKENPDNISVLLALSDVQSIIGKDAESNNILLKAKSAVQPSTVYPERYFLAEALYGKGYFREASEIYRTLIGEGSDSPAMRRLLACLVETDQRRSVFELLEGLSEVEKTEPFYLKLSGVIHRRIGDLEQAKDNFSSYLEKEPKDLQARLGWAEVLHRLGEHNLIQEFLEGPLDYPEASSEDLLHLSSLLAVYKFEEKAIAFAYELLRRYPDNPKVHLGYIALLLQSKSNPEWLNLENIAVDSTIIIETQDGNRQSFTIESRKVPRIAQNEIPPDHSIAQSALGNRIGDSITISETGFRSVEARIVSIKHKYIHALHDSIQNFELRFPEEQVLWSIPITKDDEGKPDFSPIVKTISEKKTAKGRLDQAYRKNQLPISVISRFTGLHPIRVWANIGAIDDVRILTCEGNVPERQQAINLLEQLTAPPVVDPITLYCMWIAGVQNAVIEVFGALSVTQSSIDLIEQLIEDLKSDRATGFLTTNGEQLSYGERDRDAAESEISRLESLRFWITERCSILPAVPKRDLEIEQFQLSEVMDLAFYDSLLAAEGHDRILLSEDYHYRRIANELLSVDGVWLQPVLMRALDSGILNFSQYAEAVSKLIGMGHSFTTIDSKILMHLAEEGDWRNSSDKFVHVASTLSLKTVELKSALTVVIEFLFISWDPQLFIPIRERSGFLTRMISILTRHACRETYPILEALVLMAPDICKGNPRELNEFLSTILNWCRGHFIDPPPSLRD